MTEHGDSAETEATGAGRSATETCAPPDGQGQGTVGPVSEALGAIHITAKMSCAADKDHWSLTVERAGSDFVTYGDDFYGCQTTYRGYVDTGSLDNLYATLNSLP